jgi:tripartite-type tricarboxylate transporter receptor subunit TctC
MLPSILRAAFAAGCLFAIGLAPAFAQGGYPSRPLKLVVPFAAGGAVDVVARSVGERLGPQLGQPVLIDNRPGANGNIGTEAVAKSPPDGYTLLVGGNVVVTGNLLYPKLGFNGLRDFAPIARIGYAPLVLVTAADAPYRSVQDLFAAARAQPGTLNYGSAGNGSSGHLAGALLASVGKLDALHVAYKGGAPALVDLIAGRIAFMLLNPIEVLPHLQSGRLKALAISGDQRSPLLPKVPTLHEAGVPNFEASVWWGLFAPAGTPREVVARLNAEVRKALDDKTVRERLAGLGAVVAPTSPEETADFMRSESVKWERVIRSADIHAD